ncbi:MAG: signal peptidase I, partial [Rhodospirillaceae bacterium]|nr:signal peptidase I [Rhodospirillaceae bacterium]
YRIPSSSMVPTVMSGEFILAAPDAFRDRAPRRGEVVILVAPDGDRYIKRVVGLAGDTIELRGGILHIDGRPVRRQRLVGQARLDGQRGTLYRERLPGGPSEVILERSDDGWLDDTRPYVVPQGHVFVMGDNRDNAMDSRVRTVGSVALDRLTDKPLCILWSPDPLAPAAPCAERRGRRRATGQP